MKKLLFLSIILLSLASCKQKDYVSLEVKLDGLEAGDSIMNVFGNQYNKKIKINSEGVFKDTLKIKDAGFFGLVIGRGHQVQAFLRNGFDVKINGDAKDLQKSLTFEGKGSQNSKYLLERIDGVVEFNEGLQDLYKEDSVVFKQKMSEFETKMRDLIKNVKKADTTLARLENEGLTGYVKSLNERYKMNYEMFQKFAKGKPSPKFVNYENYKGGKTSLDDLKGKFVYMDLWATWCKPCLGEIPALKELEEEYRGKNIEFVSISTDRKGDYQKWKDMVKEKDLKGVQLYFGEDMAFMQEYNVTSIPRFILVDPNGNIVDANAPRPSEKEKITKLFTESGVK